MERKYFILFIVAYISICVNGDTDRCPRFIGEECDLSLYPDDFPETVEQLKSDCSSMKTLINCIVNARENCADFKEETAYMKKVLEYIDGLCEEDNPTFLATSQNLNCSVPIARIAPRTCTDLSENTEETIKENFRKHTEDSNLLHKNIHEISHCLESYFRVSCFAIIIGMKCGDEAENAAAEILENTDYYLGLCSTDVMEKLRPFKDIFKAAVIEDPNVRNAIQEIK